MTARTKLGSVANEWSDLRLEDPRLVTRLRKMVGQIEKSPAKSFPQQMGDEASLEATYRFFQNDGVSMERLLGAHVEKTAARCSGEPVVRIIHDTTTARFDGEREGLGSLGGDARGFFVHVALAVRADETREPLGILGARTHINTEVWPSRKKTRSQRDNECAARPRDAKSSSRWEKLAMDVEKQLPSDTRAIHVMDQEADDFACIATLLAADSRFVIRGSADRRLKPQGETIGDALSENPPAIFRTVPLNERTAKQVKRSRTRHPRRAERLASLSIRTGTVEIHRHQKTQSEAKTITLNVVQVFEPAPPQGEEPIEWILLTTEPVDTIEQATAVVDHYRARWIIEELFKALKTGCAFEKRQLTTFDALQNALGLFLPVAWHLLALRHLSRATPDRPATTLFTIQQLLILRAIAGEAGYELPANPTICEAMLAIARLGGHLRRNGEPGWIVLGRGFESFTTAQAIWKLARPNDQS